MQGILFIVLVISLSVIGINADPFLFLPRHMLPPVGIVYTLTFNATAGASHQVGDYVLHALTPANGTTIIGYRAWQLYSTEDNRIGYEDYYMNGTIFQSTKDPMTQECVSIFSRRADCTGWFNTEIIRWDNRCSLSGGEVPFGTAAKMSVVADTSDLKRPKAMTVSILTDNSSEEVQLTFQFTSKIEGNTFPNVKCDY